MAYQAEAYVTACLALDIDIDETDALILALMPGERCRRAPPVLPERLTLDALESSNVDVRSLTRFDLPALVQLEEALGLSGSLVTGHGTVYSGWEGLCIYTRRLAYPARWEDLTQTFGRSCGTLCEIFCDVGERLWRRWRRRILNFDWEYLRPRFLEFSEAMQWRGCPVNNAFCSIDTKFHPIARPTKYQGTFYTGYKKLHGLKSETALSPDGLTARWRSHCGAEADCNIFLICGTRRELREHARGSGRHFVALADQGYTSGDGLVTPIRKPRNQREEEWNVAISSARKSIELSYSVAFSQLWQGFYVKKEQKVLGAGKHQLSHRHALATFLMNLRTCTEGRNTVSDFFSVQPPTLREYLGL
jgi:hypothetical protein